MGFDHKTEPGFLFQLSVRPASRQGCANSNEKPGNWMPYFRGGLSKSDKAWGRA
jgi:hypothetical protein